MLGSRHGWHSRARFDSAMAGSLTIAGVDEVGRGCLAGPVVAAAVVLPLEEVASLDLMGVTDSKKLTPKRRQGLAKLIRQRAVSIGIGEVSSREIDELNILRATQLAMGRALEKLDVPVELALIDGHVPASTRLACLPVIGGDMRSLSIAAASIVAKVYRDEWMARLHREYPQYGFDSHVGYATKLHLNALREHGITPYHRLTFAPVRACLDDRRMAESG
ncbi:ribonuclease HII [Alicyclobacillus hesperidum subsp. aegles]|uniref:ribonuclease HII n=1 Tax=Alicyclobacillus hesperidum TaxID=89784 RepID=UPI00222CBCEA|nr:ribonuclease HII [Alicyclobacillus hesperidum]GLG00537.1 ribonuclease HII [Alicyclobacillus hesperidum subsp. aegles]